MKKYALLIALAIAPSLAHDNLDIEGVEHVHSKPKLAALQTHTQPRQSHSPVAIDVDPFSEKNNSEERLANRENLASLIAEAEETIAKIQKNKANNQSEKYDSEYKEPTKLAFNKWAGLNPTPSSNYIASNNGGTGGGSSGSGGGNSGTGGNSSASNTASTSKNSSTDNRRLVATAVPEPEIYLTFAAGLGLIAYRARKRLAK